MGQPRPPEGVIVPLGQARGIAGEEGGDQPGALRREGGGHGFLDGPGPVGGQGPQGGRLRPPDLQPLHVPRQVDALREAPGPTLRGSLWRTGPVRRHREGVAGTQAHEFLTVAVEGGPEDHAVLQRHLCLHSGPVAGLIWPVSDGSGEGTPDAVQLPSPAQKVGVVARRPGKSRRHAQAHQDAAAPPVLPLQEGRQRQEQGEHPQPIAAQKDRRGKASGHRRQSTHGAPRGRRCGPTGSRWRSGSSPPA